MFHYAFMKQSINLSPEVTTPIKSEREREKVGLQRTAKSVEYQIIKVLSGGLSRETPTHSSLVTTNYLCKKQTSNGNLCLRELAKIFFCGRKWFPNDVFLIEINQICRSSYNVPIGWSIMDPFLYNQRSEGLKCLMFHFIVEKIINCENREHLHN